MRFARNICIRRYYLVIHCMCQILPHSACLSLLSISLRYMSSGNPSADSNPTDSGSGVNPESLNTIIGVASCGILLIAVALASAVLGVWVIKW